MLLLAATTFIASAGYILNDLFDIHVDSVNKKGRYIVGRKIRVHVAQVFYWVLTILGVMLGVYLSYRIGKLNYSLIFILTAGLLWFYSERYKCQPIVGNLVIALLSALVIAIVWLFYFFGLIQSPEAFTGVQLQFSKVNIFILIFSGFAFIITLIREVLKDIEDFEGDDRFGCRTFPVVYGQKKAKWLAMLITIIALVYSIWCQTFFINSDLTLLVYYFFVIDIFLLVMMIMLLKARARKDFGRMSVLTKILMLAGMLSMILVGIEF
jgi:4-hydroxybenzoate polyprenyltransferase